MGTQGKFIKYPCYICGKLISNCGFAYTKHDEMHKRKGETKENYKTKQALKETT